MMPTADAAAEAAARAASSLDETVFETRRYHKHRQHPPHPTSSWIHNSNFELSIQGLGWDG